MLNEGADVAQNRILTDLDLKKIRLAKLRKAVQTISKSGFKEHSESESSEEEMGES